jgi:hypothetical protein
VIGPAYEGERVITKSFLIVGYHRNARRIPLAGVKISVTETGSPADGPGAHLLRVTVAGIDGGSLQRSQPYSYGSITATRMFEILVNRASPTAPAAPAIPAVETPALRWAA